MLLECRDSFLGRTVLEPSHAYGAFYSLMRPDLETLCVMLLDGSHRIMTAFAAATGTVDRVECPPHVVYAPAIAIKARSILIAHNHPNGDPTPSQPDVQTTCLLDEMSKHLAIPLVDHLVLTAIPGRYRSVFEFMETTRTLGAR